MVSSGGSLICTRRPANTATPKSPVDENYVISITGNPETYILGQEYNVSLNSFNGHRYISFILALENENGDFNYMNDLGRFELSDTIETRFSPNCINMVENTNTNPKTHMHLTWTAPSEPGNGCILIRATVLQHRDVWHMDDGGLTRRICEEVVDDVESQPTGLSLSNPCCACDEARYELIFEGVWSRNLHPRNFPARGWETRFCELIGAAHSPDYRFWEPGALASEGVKQYAEHCTSRLLDREFSINFRDQKIRTIIKARGPAFPNLNSKTMASVRVDPVHHMISFASKIEPSPDWIVGVSGLELCLRNCTWLDTKVINLYPWDVGTDAGPTYTSPDQPQVPPDVIRRIRSDFPNDPRSPFYDETGAPMKPMATLTIRRQRIYERRCLDEESNNDPDVPRECQTHPWSSWSDCSSKCGEGMQYRRRVYKQPELARINNCNVPLYEERACDGQVCGMGEPMRNDFYSAGGMQQSQRPTYQQRAECQLSAWGPWSMCSVTCGEGYQTRQRQYLSPGAQIKCQGAHQVELVDTRQCAGASCLGNLNGEDTDNQYEEQQELEGAPIDDRSKSFAFPVGNLKGNQWGQDQSVDGELGTPRHPAYFQPANVEYGQLPRLQDSARAPYQRRPSDNYNVDEGRFSGQRQSVDGQLGMPRQPSYFQPTYDSTKNQAVEYGQLPRLQDSERAPYQRRPSDNYDVDEGRFSGQRQSIGNSDLDVEPERDPWQRQIHNYNNNNNHNYGKGYETNSNVPEIDLSKRCFQMLQTTPLCKNDTITGNFWFYNFCTNECMIFAVDPCDRNVNKFSRLEACEEACRRPEFQQLQQRASKSPECRAIIQSRQAEQHYWKEERRRNNYNRPRG
ncbi:hypothetical protein ACLKA6_014789 [Drosophila palustris]